jgi:alpha/beta superfamily hydrolase
VAVTRVTFPCGDLSLEGISSVPEGKGPFAAVAVCHPDPLRGGMMDNNVVIAICRALTQTSIASLRFNFRGVGRSHGKHGDGIGEQDDVAAALSFLSSMETVDQTRIGLCGYSFGASVALQVAARDEQVKALALVSPILSRPSPIESYVKPKLLLWGSQDLALPAADLKSFTEGLPEPSQYEAIPGADHFWWGYEDKAATKVAAFFADTLKPPAQA